ncbi:MAG TPA: GNAT family N-acetyltransferase [Candidatus Dormibacteraeota bacterium]|nr:GNAT family N-acetyltransferase [Candidatus Dormibacteraeota bacterium]
MRVVIVTVTVHPSIRSATQADQATIRRLVREANINPMSLDWPNFVVAEEDGMIVGVGQVKTHRDGSRELASIAVVPARQGQGIARALIETLLAREPGVVLYLTCRRELEGLYQRFGFRTLKRAEYPPYFRRMIPMINLVMRPLGTWILVMRREATG